MKSILSFVFILTIFSASKAQTNQDIINLVHSDSLLLTVNQLTGEVSSTINGSDEIITNREYQNNDLAADYIIERLEGYNNLTIEDQAFNTSGRNVIATQLGKTNPDDIYIICAHYDSVADYCADDNATGVATVLEIARILSEQCLDNTIIYALWDEEEIGLLGANYYATQAALNGDNILGVLNIDMMGYDGDEDNVFDIDVRPIANSVDMATDLENLLTTYTFDLTSTVVNPGTTASDHSRFWNQGYTAVLVGESWENNDQTPFYHSSLDRTSTLDVSYFHELAKFIMAYMVTKGNLVDVDNSVSVSASDISSNDTSGTYQWYNCETNLPLSGETNQVFTPATDGVYKVQVTSGDCIEFSECVIFSTLGLDEFDSAELRVFPNPVIDEVEVSLTSTNQFEVNLYDVSGKLLKQLEDQSDAVQIKMKDLPSGVYFLKINTLDKSSTIKLIKN
ncbi:MAG: hypothetical protein BM564_04740 [Bacteroidetes bacterium MedPE-SWsnd-G2]|nr:MAG: hypothetical protein BM564_04740 [Bacteroidetes bacterium MedPE-SWsnd-G2]